MKKSLVGDEAIKLSKIGCARTRRWLGELPRISIVVERIVGSLKQ